MLLWLLPWFIIQEDTSDTREKPIFDSRIMKFVFRSGDVNFVILVEDSNIGSPSSITVKWNAYLFFNSHIVNFVWESDEGETGNILLILFFGGALIIVGEG